MRRYLKFYDYAYDINILHTARSMIVLQEDDIELTVHFTWEMKNNYCFVNAVFYKFYWVSNTKWFDSCPYDSRTVSRSLHGKDAVCMTFCDSHISSENNMNFAVVGSTGFPWLRRSFVCAWCHTLFYMVTD